MESRFSLDRMVADYAALYERVAARSASKRAAPPMKDAPLETRTGH